MTEVRIEKDTLGEIAVPTNCLWGAQTARSLKFFNIGTDLIPKEMITSFAILKKGAALVNFKKGLLNEQQKELIVKVCDEIIAGKHDDQFPLRVWMTGSGTQFNMNINEVISNRACQLTHSPLGSKHPIHPNDHVNKSQSSNDTFPTAMCMAAAMGTTERLIPELEKLTEAVNHKAAEWMNIIKIGRTHMQDATPMTLGQEFSGYGGMLADNLTWLKEAVKGVYFLALGGTAIGTGINAPKGFDHEVAKEIANLTGLPFVSAPNKFTVQGSHDALVHLSGTLKTLATSLHKIARDLMILSSGPRCGFAELHLPKNEPGSSIMPGKVNPTQCEALAMIAVQVTANDLAVTLAGGGGLLEMNVYKTVMIDNLLQSIRLLEDGCRSFRINLIDLLKPNLQQLDYFVQRSLMLATALNPIIGYEKASQITHYAVDHDLTLKQAALALGYITEEEFDLIVDPAKMIGL